MRYLFCVVITIFGISGMLPAQESFHFVVTGDPHMYRYADGATKIHWGFRNDLLQHVKHENVNGPGDFIVVVGDMDPFRRVRQSVRDVMGGGYGFYPVIGNHDVGGTNNHGQDYPEDNWQNAFGIVTFNRDSLKNVVHWGPDVPSPELSGSFEKDGVKYVTYYDSAGIHGAKYTSYSFDYGNSHFVVLDEYATQSWGARGNARIWEGLYDWLKKDLDSTDKENIFVFGHEPLWTSASLGDAPVSRDDFWEVLKQHKVVAYFCGHVHDYAITDHEGVWEVRPSCAYEYPGKTHYSMVFVDSNVVKLKTYEMRDDGFVMMDSRVLKGDGTVEPDNIPPVARAGNDQTLMDNDGDGFAQVTLDGTGSSDSDGRIVAWKWTEDTVVISTDSIVTCDLPVGTHNIGLTVTDNDGAQDSDICKITIFRSPTYRSAERSQKRLLIYPNPASGTLNILLPAGDHNSIVEIFDPAGKKIYSRKSGPDASVQVNMQHCLPGNYFVRIVTGKEYVTSPFILK